MNLQDWLEANNFYAPEKSKRYYQQIGVSGIKSIVVHLTLIDSDLQSEKYNNKYYVSHFGKELFLTEDEVKEYIRNNSP